MALKATTVRVSEDLWQLLERESARQGVSVAQFLRDCALLRLGQLSGARGDAAATTTIEGLAHRSLGERRRYVGDDRMARLSAPDRLTAVERTDLVDQPADPGLDRLAQLAAKVLGVETVLVTLVEPGRQFFAAATGLCEPWASRRETGLSHSFCQEVVMSRQPFIVSDAREHPLVRDNLAIRDLNVIAYAGIPLIGAGDEVIGSFCAIDGTPHSWTSTELDLLREFADSVSHYIETRAAGRPGSRARPTPASAVALR